MFRCWKVWSIAPVKLVKASFLAAITFWKENSWKGSGSTKAIRGNSMILPLALSDEPASFFPG